jgi:hypothetical protein
MLYLRNVSLIVETVIKGKSPIAGCPTPGGAELVQTAHCYFRGRVASPQISPANPVLLIGDGMMGRLCEMLDWLERR